MSLMPSSDLAGAGMLDLKLDKAEGVARAIVAEGGEARAFACSVLDTKAMQEHAEPRKVWGVPDILINGAGGTIHAGAPSVEYVEKADLGNPDMRASSTSTRMALQDIAAQLPGTVPATRVFSRAMVGRGPAPSSTCAP